MYLCEVTVAIIFSGCYYREQVNSIEERTSSVAMKAGYMDVNIKLNKKPECNPRVLSQ